MVDRLCLPNTRGTSPSASPFGRPRPFKRTRVVEPPSSHIHEEASSSSSKFERRAEETKVLGVARLHGDLVLLVDDDGVASLMPASQARREIPDAYITYLEERIALEPLQGHAAKQGL